MQKQSVRRTGDTGLSTLPRFLFLALFYLAFLVPLAPQAPFGLSPTGPARLRIDRNYPERIENIRAQDEVALRSLIDQALRQLSSQRVISSVSTGLCTRIVGHIPERVNVTHQPYIRLTTFAQDAMGRCTDPGNAGGQRNPGDRGLDLRWNDPTAILGEALTGPDGKDLVVERSSVHIAPVRISHTGSTSFFERFVMIERPNVSLWVPVTREEYLTAVIATWDRVLQTPGNESLNRDREAARADLASLSQQDRRAQACLTDHAFSSAGPVGPCAAGTALVRINPAYFARMQSAAEPRLLIAILDPPSPSEDPSVRALRESIFTGIDYAGLARLTFAPK